MTSKPGRGWRCAIVLCLSGLSAGLFGGCVGVNHHLHRHMPFAQHVENHEAGYYHCEKCGRVIPHGDGCGCGEIIERPYFGYNATCWQPWPADWQGCQEGDEVMVSGDPFLQVPVDNSLPVSDPSPPAATPEMFWDDPSAHNHPVLPSFRPQSLPSARPAVESAGERGNELAELDTEEGPGVDVPLSEESQELFGPSETVAEVPAEPSSQDDAESAPAVLNHVPVNWYFNSLGRDESLVRKLMRLRTARRVRPAKREIEDSTVRFFTAPDDASRSATDDKSDRGRLSQHLAPSPRSTVRLMIPR